MKTEQTKINTNININTEEVTDHATKIAMLMLSMRNTNMTEIHERLIKATCEGLIRAAAGRLPYRIGNALPTGAGKTTCVARMIFRRPAHSSNLFHESPRFDTLLDGHFSGAYQRGVARPQCANAPR